MVAYSYEHKRRINEQNPQKPDIKSLKLVVYAANFNNAGKLHLLAARAHHLIVNRIK